ncbi:MAG: mechanosensitive ion channel family protein [Eubacteriales bacterium]|nr:mechanosensitive ion channel family protein [Eubacteriales bacterium]
MEEKTLNETTVVENSTEASAPDKGADKEKEAPSKNKKGGKRKKSRGGWKAAIIVFILGILGVIAMFATDAYNEFIEKEAEARSTAEILADSFLVRTDADELIDKAFNDVYLTEAKITNQIFSDYNIHTLSDYQREAMIPEFKEYIDRTDCVDMMIFGKKGDLIIASDKERFNINLIDAGIFTAQEFAELTEYADTPAFLDGTERPEIVSFEMNGQISYGIISRLLNSKDELSPYYLLMIYDPEAVESQYSAWVDKTFIFDSVISKSEHLDVMVFNNGELAFNTYEPDKYDRATFKASELQGEYRGTVGSITLRSSENPALSHRIDYAYAVPIVFSEDNVYTIVATSSPLKNKNEAVHLFGASIALGIVLISMIIVFAIYWVYAYRAIRNKRIFSVLSLAVAVVILVAFAVFAYFFQSLEDLTKASNNAENLYAQIQSTYAYNKVDRENRINQLNESDIKKARLISFDAEYTNSKLQTGNVNVYFDTDNNGNAVPVKDSFGNDLICYGDSELLNEKTAFFPDADMWIINDKGYAIASSAEENWYLNTNKSDEKAKVRSVMYREVPYLIEDIDESDPSKGYIIMMPVKLHAYSENGMTHYVGVRTYDRLVEQAEEERLERAEKAAEAARKAAEATAVTEPLVTDSGAASGSGTGTNKNAEAAAQFNGPVYSEIMGVLYIRTHSESGAIMMNQYNTNQTLETLVRASGASYAEIIYDNENGITRASRIISTPEDNLDLNEIVIPVVMKNLSLYNYFQNISQKKCYVRLKKDITAMNAGVIVMTMATVHETRETNVVAFLFIAFLIIALAYIIFWIGTVLIKKKNAAGETGYVKDAKQLFSSIGEIKKNKSAQIPILILRAILITATGLIIDSIIRNGQAGDVGLFVNIYSKEWERGLNAYNIGAAIALITLIVVVFNFVKSVISIICEPLGRKPETYAKLAVSVVQYALIFCGLFYGAYLLGMEVKDISTFATVFTGVVGIGSREFISDIGSGISILAEGRYMLGDFVEVQGFKGTVKEIGIRKCILVNENGVEKSVTNGNMSNAILYKNVKPAKPGEADGANGGQPGAPGTPANGAPAAGGPNAGGNSTVSPHKFAADLAKVLPPDLGQEAPDDDDEEDE